MYLTGVSWGVTGAHFNGLIGKVLQLMFRQASGGLLTLGEIFDFIFLTSSVLLLLLFTVLFLFGIYCFLGGSGAHTSIGEQRQLGL